MRSLTVVSDPKAAGLLLHPLRSAILRKVASEPATCTELAAFLGVSPQRVANHMRELVAVGFVQQVGSRRRRSLSEKIYRASALAFWLSPEMAHPVGPSGAALGALAAEAERISKDAADLYVSAVAGTDIASLTLTVELGLSGPEARAAFARDLAEAVEDVVRHHQTPGATEHYRVSLVGYPSPEGKESER